MRFLCQISCALLLALTHVAARAQPALEPRGAPALEFTTARHAYVRGEKARLQVRVTGAPDGAVLHFEAGGWLPAETAPRAETEYVVDTALLRAADYDVQARLMDRGREVARALFPLSVTPERNAQRYPVYRWHGIPSDEFAWWRSRGFNGFVSPRLYDPLSGASDAAIGNMLDEAARAGFEVGCYLNPFLSTRTEWDAEALVQAVPPAPKGKRRPKLYPRHPSVVAHAESLARSWTERFREFPAWSHALLSTEYQIAQNLSPLARRLAREEVGVDLAQIGTLTAPKPEHLPQGGLIDDDNPHYRYLRWWWHTGIGDALVNRRMAEALKSARPDVLTWHDPYRLAAVRGSNQGMDAVSTWTYAHPDSRRLLYTTALQAVARPERQKVMQTITLFLYGRFAVPLERSTAVLGRDEGGADPFYTIGPDFVREATWLAFSQRPDLLCYYSHSTQSPNPTRDPDIVSPETYDAIGETVRTLVEPLGPMVLASRRPPAQVAVLMSAVSEWFGKSPRNVGYPTEQFLPYAALLAMNHVPFEVLLDDDIVEGALQRYSTLVLPRPSVMTRRMHAAILAFVERGGRVIADASLGAAIPGATLTSYDFVAQNRVDGAALAAGRAITAEDDRTAQEGYAADLQRQLGHVSRPARAASPRVVVNTLQAGAAQLVFFVNADKTYGSRFGQHRLHFEAGVRLTTQGRIRIQGKPTLYDVIARKPVAYREENGEAVFDLELPSARGKVVAVYPEAVGAPVIAPPIGRPGEVTPIRVTIPGASGKPLAAPHPLRIEIIDPQGRRNEYTRFAACADGVYMLPFRAALNDPAGKWTVRVVELIGGKTTEATFSR